MQATKKQKVKAAISLPEPAVPNAVQARKLVNRWLQAEVGMAVSAAQPIFNMANYTWHLPIHLAYASTGPIGTIGDVYLHAGTGEFIGRPDAKELLERAIALAKSHGLVEQEGEEEI